MEQPDLNYVKTIIKSVLTSSPINVTISQVLLDYAQLEGSSIPYQQLGFNTVYDLLKDMGDVLKIPHNPNMYSSIKLIVDEKTSHLRELIVNQKVNKKKRSKSYPRKNFSSASSKYNLSKWNVKSKYGNTNNYSYYNNNSCASDPNARGYDYIRIKSADDPKPKGIVTNKLQKNIEHLCSSSQTINISTLKEYLICHPDFGKLQTSNIEDAINMLKYFIYIDKGVIHLKNSPYDIFPSTEWDKRNNKKPVSSVPPYQIFPSVVWDKKNDTKPVPSFEIPPSFVDELDELSITNDLMDEDIYCFMQDLNLNTEYECEPSLNKVQTKNNSDLFIVDKKNENLSKGSTILNDNPLNKNVSKASTILSAKHSLHNESNIKLKSNTYEKSIPKSLKNNGIDYKNMIVSIIMESKTPITVKEVLANFIEIHGYSFPFQKFSCRTCMDYFRLYPAIFNLEDQFSTNSIIRLEEQSIFKRSSTNRDKFIKSTIFKHDNLEKIKLVENTSELSLNVNNYSNQDFDEPIKETCCKKSVHEYEILDSEMILDSMKAKMRCILNKYTNGILCNEFMDIYAYFEENDRMLKTISNESD